MIDKKKILAIFLLVIFFKSLIFAMVVPIWHTPDEQAHFAQIAYNGEFGRMPTSGFDLNEEIYRSEELLGTLRDERGNNKFTYHPEYRIDYSDNKIGIHEDEISSMSIESRKNLIRQEATNYPPLYYEFGTLTYNLFYFGDLFDRVYAVRFVSILLSLATVFVVLLIGKKIFPDNFIKQILLAIFVGFHPMFSFVASGVNSDNLFNLLFSIFLLICLEVLESGIKIRNLISFFGVIILMYFTKPQVAFSIPIFLSALGLWFVKDFKEQKKSLFSKKAIFLVIVTTMLILVTIFFYYISRISHFPIEGVLGYLYSFAPGGREIIQISFWDFLKTSLKHTYAETIPWYWGVFDWLGVVLPRVVNRALNWIAVFAVIGLGVKYYKDFRASKFDYKATFLILATLIYYMGITYYNYIFTLAHGYSFGIQGRYFFPTLVAHMGLLIIGLLALIPDKLAYLKLSVIKTLGVGMIILNFIALWVLITTYYDVSNLNVFITQISQYKIGIFKGLMVIFWFLIYFICLALLLKYLIIYNDKTEKK